MAIIDYIGIETKIKTLLNADSRTSGYTVEIEPEDPINEARCPYVAIYLDNYETLLDTFLRLESITNSGEVLPLKSTIVKQSSPNRLCSPSNFLRKIPTDPFGDGLNTDSSLLIEKSLVTKSPLTIILHLP